MRLRPQHVAMQIHAWIANAIISAIVFGALTLKDVIDKEGEIVSETT